MIEWAEKIAAGTTRASCDPWRSPEYGVPRPSELSGRLGINDAEMNLSRAAQEQGTTINAIGATRPVCYLCQMRLPDESHCYGVGILMRYPPEELLQQEVRELTDLLRHADSFADLRDVLAARGASASETISSV